MNKKQQELYDEYLAHDRRARWVLWLLKGIWCCLPVAVGLLTVLAIVWYLSN